MIDQESSYFYYPTTTLIVDDNKELLDSLVLSLNTRGDELVRTFLNPIDALSYLRNCNSIYANYQNYLEAISGIETDSDDKDKVSKINFNSIYTLPYNKNRYSEVSVIIVDYAMPQMSGIEFVEKIKDIPAKKILLTGNADYELAVDAFNVGLIDNFMLKKVGVEEKLLKSIGMFKKRYFHRFSETLLHVFDKGVMKASQYASVASIWRTKYKISEYYQCDGNGSCLGFDNAGEIYWLLICSNKDIRDYVSIAENSDGSHAIADELRLRTKLLFFFSEKEKLLPVTEWEKYMFPIHGDFAVNNEKYFYSLMSNKSLGIDLEKVKNISQYLKDYL